MDHFRLQQSSGGNDRADCRGRNRDAFQLQKLPEENLQQAVNIEARGDPPGHGPLMQSLWKAVQD